MRSCENICNIGNRCNEIVFITVELVGGCIKYIVRSERLFPFFEEGGNVFENLTSMDTSIWKVFFAGTQIET